MLEISNSRPSPDQLEVTVFGAGIGECVVVHYGNNRWLVVDSFVHSESKIPVAIEYLRHLNIDLKNDVKFVCASHWHDDHIKGISKVVEECSGAEIIVSSAIVASEFLEIVGLQASHEKSLKGVKTGVSEIRSVFEISKARLDGGKGKQLKQASIDRVFLDEQPTGTKIFSMSPSDAEKMLALDTFKSFLPEGAGKPKKRVLTAEPNDCATVLCVEFGGTTVLLGSDLEVHTSADRGWRSVMNAVIKPSNKSVIFKIPHHGSVNAHLDEVWRDLLHATVYAVLTPFTRGKTPLPRKDDVNRILEKTADAHQAGASRILPSSASQSRTVQKIIKENIRSYRALNTKTGIVRIRTSIQGQPFTVEYGGAAAQMQVIA